MVGHHWLALTMVDQHWPLLTVLVVLTKVDHLDHIGKYRSSWDPTLFPGLQLANRFPHSRGFWSQHSLNTLSSITKTFLTSLSVRIVVIESCLPIIIVSIKCKLIILSYLILPCKSTNMYWPILIYVDYKST